MTSVPKNKSFSENYHKSLYSLRCKIANYRWSRWLVTQSVYDAFWGTSRGSLAVLALKCDRAYEKSRQPQPNTVQGELREMALLCEREGIPFDEIVLACKKQGIDIPELLVVGGAA